MVTVTTSNPTGMLLDDRRYWRRLRYEYYVGARSALMVGNFRVAGILFGYTIETSIKHALIESGYQDETVLRSHEVKQLMDVFRSRKVFDKISVSNDFLRYVIDNFDVRYPSSQRRVVRRAEKKNRFLIKSIDYFPYYDDLILQLDNAIYSYTSDIESTMALDAFGDIGLYNGRVFFHMNLIACARLPEYLNWIPENRISSESFAELQKGKDYLWDCKSMYRFDPRPPDKLPDWHPAKDFKYPQWVKTPYGKLITISTPVEAGPNDQPKFTLDDM